MDPAHAHLVLNHFPIVGTLIGLVILAVGFFAKKTQLVNTGLLTIVVLALFSIPLLPTGEAAEEAIENIPGIEEQYVEAHEEIGQKAVFIMVGLGILAFITLMVSIKGLAAAKVLTLFTLVASIGVFGLMAKVGSTGGEIRHTEIRKSGKVQTDTESHIRESSTEHHEEDDD